MQELLDILNNTKNTLDNYYENLEQEMAAIVNKMADAEDSLVGKAGN